MEKGILGAWFGRPTGASLQLRCTRVHEGGLRKKNSRRVSYPNEACFYKPAGRLLACP
jgi:hypothetical protein